MILYLDIKTDAVNGIIDFIEIKLKSGKTITIDWDESEIERSIDGFSARYKGLYFNEHYANDKLDDLTDMEIEEIQLYADRYTTFSIDFMEFLDTDRTLTFDNPKVKHIELTYC